MASTDPIFTPRVRDADVIDYCRAAFTVAGPHPIAHVVAHAIVARRVTAVADLDITDGPAGRFIRTGAVPAEVVAQLWIPLFGRVYMHLPADLQVQADALAVYLRVNVGREAVAGWPNP